MPNALIHEQSPYLLQHAHNPVDWRPWGDTAFLEAQEKGLPLIVSIGYSACHWCHVMERESFEDEETAAYMNEHFICIKVDREEHPDVDAMYMDAVQAIAGSGGWPLNVFVTPDRIPFFGGTYFPPKPYYGRPSWLGVMQRMVEIWRENPEQIKEQTDQMMAFLQQTSAGGGNAAPGSGDTINFGGDCAATLLKMADREWGGFGAAPKFPGTMAITFLLEHFHYSGDDAALEHALLSLDKMIAGGIYDQLGGGFARYSTDKEWLAPHFEKMLYDNALLIATLSDAYTLLTTSPDGAKYLSDGSRLVKYRAIIEETIAFINRELRDGDGGFYCALDADSEGVEGKFYTWNYDDFTAAAGNYAGIGAAYFGVREEGNWEETNILTAHKSFAEIAAAFGIEEEEARQQISALRKKLFEARSGRIRPATDDKCLLSWNALMNIALTRAGIALEREDYLSQAADHAQWMLKTFAKDGMMMHTSKGGVARVPGKLDDYAYLIQALLQTGAATHNNGLIHAAAYGADYVLQHFKKEGSPHLFLSSDAQADIPVRKLDVYDGAQPSANAVMMHNLCLLGMIMERSEWTAQATEGIEIMAGNAARYTYSFAYWAVLGQRLRKGINTAVIAGTHAADEEAHLRKSFSPGLFTIAALTGGKELPVAVDKAGKDEILIFVCTANACLPPVSTAEQALALLKPGR